MHTETILGLALLCLIAFAAGGAYLLLRPNTSVYLDANGLSARFHTYNADSATQILYVLYSIAYIRAELWNEVPGDATIVTKFDQVWDELLANWASVEDGSFLSSPVPHTSPVMDPSEHARIDVAFVPISANTLVLTGITTTSDSANLLYLFAALVVRSVAFIPGPNRDVLRDALQRLRYLSVVQPTWSSAPLFQLSKACRTVYRATTETRPFLQPRVTDRRLQWSILFRVVIDTIGIVLRQGGVLAYPVLWWLWKPQVFTLVTLGLACHGLSRVVGQIAFGLSWNAGHSRVVLFKSIGEQLAMFSQWLKWRMLPFATLLVSAAAWYQGSTWLEIAIYIGITVACCIFASVLHYRVALPILVINFRICWNGHLQPDGVSIYPRTLALDRIPVWPSANFLLSHTVFQRGFIFGLGATIVLLVVRYGLRLDPEAVLADTRWGWVLIVVMVIFALIYQNVLKYAIVKAHRNLCKTRILLLRRFKNTGSHAIVTLVSPAFGSYGEILSLRDETYQYWSDLQYRLEESSQQDIPRVLGGTLVEISNEEGKWKDRVTQGMKWCDLCVIDVSDIGEGLAWEIATALMLLQPAQIVLVAPYELAIRETLYKQVEAAVHELAATPEFRTEIRTALNEVAPPILYGPIPLSWFFLWHVYRLFASMRPTTVNGLPAASTTSNGCTGES